jgi:hypothetical protein
MPLSAILLVPEHHRLPIVAGEFLDDLRAASVAAVIDNDYLGREGQVGSKFPQVFEGGAELIPAIPGRNDYRDMRAGRTRRHDPGAGLKLILNKAHKVCV